jgi:hypothetical protein
VLGSNAWTYPVMSLRQIGPRLDSWLETRLPAVRWAAYISVFLFSLVYLSIGLADDGIALPPDSAAFLGFVNGLVEVFHGQLTLEAFVQILGERTYVYQLPIAAIAALVGIYNYKFYLLLYWLLYVTTIPVVCWAIARTWETTSYLTYLLPLLIFADTPIPYLAVGGFFTDLPPITFALASFWCFSLYMRAQHSSAMLFAAVFLASCLLTKWQTATYIVPTYLASTSILTWNKGWRILLRPLAQLILLSALIMGIWVWWGMLWVPLQKGYELATTLTESIWRFGNAGSEYFIQGHVFQHRLHLYLGYLAFGFSAILIGYLVGVDWSSKKGRQLGVLVAVVVGFNTAWATYYFSANIRYVLPIVFGILVLFTCTPARQRGQRLAASVLTVYLLVDSLIFHIDTNAAASVNGSVATLNRLRMTAAAKIAPSYAVGAMSRLLGKEYVPEYAVLLHHLNDLRALDGRRVLYVVDLVPPADSRYGTTATHLESELRVRRKENSDWAALREHTIFLGAYISELVVPSIYAQFLETNVSALLRAEVLIVPVSVEDYPPHWVEKTLVENLEELRDVGEVGLEGGGRFKVHGLKADAALVPRYAIYHVQDRMRWVEFIKRVACKHPAVRASTQSVRDCRNPVIQRVKDLSKGEGMMAGNVSEGTVDRVSALIIDLVRPPLDGFKGVFVHLVPKEKRAHCEFTTLDHLAKFVARAVTYVHLTAEQEGLLQRCSYTVNVGVEVMDRKHTHVFFWKDYLQATREAGGGS